MATCDRATTTKQPDKKFSEALQYAQEQLDVEFILKDKQREALWAAFNGRDVVVILPTGYGKSLIFQLLPWVLQKRWDSPQPMITFVVTPLNSIMQDQVAALAKRGIKACFLNITGTGGTTYEVLKGAADTLAAADVDSDISDKEEEDISVFSEKQVTLSSLKNGEYVLVYAHPEALVCNTQMGRILRSSTYQKRTGCIAVDEVHMISEWGEEFRTAFTKLADLNALFSDAAHIAVTATLAQGAIKKLLETLQLKNSQIVQLNPDRPNIFLDIKNRLPNIRKLDKYDDLIQPLCHEIKNLKQDFPVTIVYVENLDALGYYYQYLEHNMGSEAYLLNKPRVPEHRIFAMYHKDYTSQMKSLVVKELTKQTPIIRLILATVALGMGLDAPSVSRVIHFCPPTTMGKYFQEIGRAGRKGQKSEAVMYFNNSDLASNRPGLSQDIVKFCRNETDCLRKNLLEYFGFKETVFSGPQNQCCRNCKKNVVSIPPVETETDISQQSHP